MNIKLTLLDSRGRPLEAGIPLELLSAGEVIARAESHHGVAQFSGDGVLPPNLRVRLDRAASQRKLAEQRAE